MKKVFGKIGLVSLGLLFISVQFYETECGYYFTNDIAEFIARPVLFLWLCISLWALLEMSFGDN